VAEATAAAVVAEATAAVVAAVVAEAVVDAIVAVAASAIPAGKASPVKTLRPGQSTGSAFHASGP